MQGEDEGDSVRDVVNEIFDEAERLPSGEMMSAEDLARRDAPIVQLYRDITGVSGSRQVYEAGYEADGIYDIEE
ncbi:hypothetical protein ACFL0V_02325 [Nanoarchaeota archaeon]